MALKCAFQYRIWICNQNWLCTLAVKFAFHRTETSILKWLWPERRTLSGLTKWKSIVLTLSAVMSLDDKTSSVHSKVPVLALHLHCYNNNTASHYQCIIISCHLHVDMRPWNIIITCHLCVGTLLTNWDLPANLQLTSLIWNCYKQLSIKIPMFGMLNVNEKGCFQWKLTLSPLTTTMF